MVGKQSIDPKEAFGYFVNRVLERGKAERFTALSATKKGQRKILVGLCHEFDHAILPRVVRHKDYGLLWEKQCFVYYEPLGFGIEFETVRRAYEQLSVDDSWLILVRDASAGIYRPEQW